MKKIILIIILIFTSTFCFSQTKLRGNLRFDNTVAVYPVMDLPAVMAHVDSSFNWMPYNILMNETGDSIRLFYNRGVQFVATSPITDGLTFYNRKVVTISGGAPYVDQAITYISPSLYRSLYHSLSNIDGTVFHQSYKMVTCKSTDKGITWVFDQTAGVNDTMYTGSKTVKENSQMGEDVSSFYNSDSSKIYIYFRDSTSQQLSYPSGQHPLRTIALSKTTDMKTFGPRTVVIPKTRSNYHNTNSKDYRIQFYEMSVIQTAFQEYWGFCNVMKYNAAGTMDQPTPTGTDDIIETRLYYSTDAENWISTTDSLPFMKIHDSIKQVFSIPIVVGSEVWIYTIENTQRHNGNSTYVASLPVGSGKWKIFRYRISIANLRLRKP